METKNIKLTDNESIKALERLKNTKDYLKEQYQEQVKKCPYLELKPIAKQTYEDNKKAFDIAIKAIEEFNRLQTEIEKYELEIKMAQDKAKACKHYYDECLKDLEKANAEIERLKKGWKADVILTADAKAEAVKECIEKVKETAQDISEGGFKGCYLISKVNLDNLLKEMVGEDK